MDSNFIFNLTQIVRISERGETGKIIGRAEYTEAENIYLLRYTAANGCAVEGWFREGAISCVRTGD